MANHTEFLDVSSEYLIDSYRITNTFDLISGALPLAQVAARAKHRILLNLDRTRWDGLERILPKVMDQRMSVVSHAPASFCWRNSRMPNDRLFETTGIDIGALRSILFADALPEIAAFYNAPEDVELGPRNLESIQQTVAHKIEWCQEALGSLPIRERMNAVARAKVFISHDDNNEITNSIWMPKDSLIIIFF
jgi:hypothetical protein